MPGGNVGDKITGITYNGVAMTQQKKQGVNVNQYLYLYDLVAPATGANNVVITSSSSTDIGGKANSYTGVKQTGQPDATASGTATGNLTLNLTTTDNNCWSIIIARNLSLGVPGAGTNVTARASGGLFLLGDSNGSITPAGSFSQTATAASGTTGGCMLSFSPVASAPSVGSSATTLMMGV